MKNNIAKLRKEMKISQAKLGKLIGVTQATISSWEKGRTEADHESANKLAKLFRVTIGYLTGYEYERVTVPVSTREYIDLGMLNPHDLSDDEEDEEFPSYEKQKFDRDDIVGIKEDTIYTVWGVEHSRTMPYELYRIGIAMQHMDADEKKRLLLLARTSFPEAFR